MPAEHSPTPWVLRKIPGTEMTAAIVSADGIEIGDREADAEFIVCACNAHDELVAIVREMQTVVLPPLLGLYLSHFPKLPKAIESALQRLDTTAKATLAKLERAGNDEGAR